MRWQRRLDVQIVVNANSNFNGEGLKYVILRKNTKQRGSESDQDHKRFNLQQESVKCHGRLKLFIPGKRTPLIHRRGQEGGGMIGEVVGE